MSSQKYSLAFLPYLRLGLGADGKVSKQDRFHRSKNVKVNLVNDAGQSLHREDHKITLRGPAEIIGLHGHVVARTEPKHGTNDFEPNYFPFIEFKDPDFLWRYSLHDPKGPGRLKPWIVLLVLTRDAFTTERFALNDKQYGIKLTIKDSGVPQLPALEKTWAWAHVHFSDSAALSDEKSLAQSLFEQPAKNCSRLLCPRKLEPLTLYSSFVVPTYEIGRLAGLGLPLPKPDSTTGAYPSWVDQPWIPETGIELPIYYRFDFQTSEAGDFEDLIHKIIPEECPDNVGTRKIDGSRPGHFTDGNPAAENMFQLEGALLPLGKESTALTPASSFSEAVAPELSRAIVSDKDTDEDPFITIPVYGQHYRRDVIKAFKAGNQNKNDWIREINLDQRYRTAAGMGTQVVQKNQEEYMHLCWQQVGAIREANEEIRRGAVGVLMSERVKTRHLDKMSDERYIAITGEFHHYFASNGSSFKEQFAQTGIPKGFLTYASRKVIAQKTRLADSSMGRGVQKYIKSRLEAQPPSPSDAKKKLLSASPLWGDIVSVKPFTFTNTNITTFKGAFNIRDDIRSRLNGMIFIGDKVAPITDIEPIMAAPTIPYAMYEHLNAHSVEYMLPNLKELKNNTVVLMTENRKFIEAYMIGLNHEMGRELVWREYPTDRRGTIFFYFWEPLDPEQSEGDIEPIYDWGTNALGEDNPQKPGSDSIKERTIFAVKADLIRRYPDAIFYAVEITKDAPKTSKKEIDWKMFFKSYDVNGQVPNGFVVKEPEISARIGNDTLFMGYAIDPDDIRDNPGKYFFVIAQVSSLPRFGLDEAKENGAAPHGINDLRWDHMTLDGCWINPTSEINDLDNGKTWNSDNTSTVIAQCTLQLPVRLVIPAKKLVKI